MPDAIDATAARRQFGELLRRVATGERVIVEARGRARVAIVSIEDLRLVEAVERFATERPAPADWSSVFPELAELDPSGLKTLDEVPVFDTSNLKTLDEVLPSARGLPQTPPKAP